MEPTNRQKTDAVNEAYTKRMKAREHYAELADVGDEDARRKLAGTDRALGRLQAEARRLAAERSGHVAGEGSDAMRASERYHDAIEHTRRIEEEFRQDLARLGHTDGHTPKVSRQIEEQALGYIRESYGEPAADHCRRMLAPVGQGVPLEGRDLASIPPRWTP